MSNTTIIHIVIIGAAVLAFAAYAGFVLVPAWTAYSRIWERVCAAFLSLYVLAVFAALGIAGGAAVIYFWGG